jgi:UDP-N-acetylmuramoyl-L-alanyl-D-glutamate--2,6-diaminopimelate ligase
MLNNVISFYKMLKRMLCNYVLYFMYKLFYNKIKVIGVTGTDGKTTTTYLIRNYINKLNNKNKCGLIGTEIIHDGKNEYKSVLTTPDPIVIFKNIVQMNKNECTHCAMEVSSHGIDQKRANFIDFDCAIFTNITQDHLDYHKTFENYLNTKISFLKNTNNYIIINKDDEHYNYINKEINKKHYTYGQQDSDFQIKNVNLALNGSIFDLVYNNQIYKFEIQLLGIHNIYNFTACIAYLILSNYDINALQTHSKFITPPPGRLEKIMKNIYVDYAHTPYAMSQMIKCFRAISDKKIVVVFGAGGNRDTTKRKLMGKVSSNADIIILTTDSPRFENPLDICNQIFPYVENDNKKIILDRYDALEYVLTNYINEIILVMGKGNESFIQINGKNIEFNDKNVILNILKKNNY